MPMVALMICTFEIHRLKASETTSRLTKHSAWSSAFAGTAQLMPSPASPHEHAEAQLVTADLTHTCNMAAVMVSATLPPFAQPGTKIISSPPRLAMVIGGVPHPACAADGQTYAVAQGPVITGGFVAGRGGSTQPQLPRLSAST